MTVKLRIRPARAGKTALVYLLVLLVSFIFAFPCVWLVLSAFNAEGDLLTLDGFFPKEYSSTPSAGCSRRQTNTIIRAGSAIRCSSLR